MIRCSRLLLVISGLIGSLSESSLSAPPPSMAQPATPQTLDTLLAVDATTKEVTVTNGTPQTQFTFNLTNVSPAELVISGVFTSCGCTAAKLPEAALETRAWHQGTD
jgi:hypothetical protein